ncbi:MAG: hypothetical protein PQJ58_02155 [Spirochaetales bacterium]|nr:hypothetical protein [Spirochaetales bacterium]
MKQSLFLSVLIFSLFLNCLPLTGEEQFEHRLLLLENTLLDSRNKGDFLTEEGIRKTLETDLAHETDSLNRTALKRLLYMESIALPENIFFDTDISSMTVVDDDLWLGSRSGDIARYSLSERQWKSYARGQESLSIRTVQAILPDRERIWFLSYGSVGVYSRRHDRIVSLPVPDEKEFRGLQSAVVMGSGLIAGTQSKGLRRIRLDSQSVLPRPGDLRNITYLQFMDREQLLAGTEENGLYILDRFYNARPAGSGSSQLSAVRVLLGDPSDSMIAGSYGGGLYKLVREGASYDIVLLNSRARWITGGVELSGLYCFSTLGNGLLVMDKEARNIRSLGISEGLSGLDLSSAAYVAPFIICAVQGQGLIKIHEDIFRTP